MPITHVLEPESPWIRTTVTGPVTFEEVRAHVLSQVDARIIHQPELIDAVRAERPTLSSIDIRRIVGLTGAISRQHSLGARAIVTHQDTMYGMARMFGILASAHVQVGVFRTVEEAEAWLMGAGKR